VISLNIEPQRSDVDLGLDNIACNSNSRCSLTYPLFSESVVTSIDSLRDTGECDWCIACLLLVYDRQDGLCIRLTSIDARSEDSVLVELSVDQSTLGSKATLEVPVLMVHDLQEVGVVATDS
jgi:hypothetical protein